MRLVDTVEFLQHVDNYSAVDLNVMTFESNEESNNFLNRMERLLHNVVKRLPEEEQFMPWMSQGIADTAKVGEILFGTRNQLSPVWEALSKGDAAFFVSTCQIPFHPETLENMKRISDLAPDFVIPWDSNCAYDNDIPFYVVTIVTDNLAEKSDDYIIGLIAHAISQMSYAWREKKVMSGLLDSLETQGYEDNARGEARRLGFGKEMDKFK